MRETRTVQIQGDMSEQQSKKSGLRSEGLKETAARNPYETIPPANTVGGAFGERQPQPETDENLVFRLQEKKSRSENEDESQN